MKKTILFAALLLSASLTFAQVTRGTVGQGNYTAWDGQTTVCNGIDFNNDGILEMKFNLGYDLEGGTWENGSVEFDYQQVQIVAQEGAWDYFDLLGANTSVNVGSNLAGEGDAMFYDITEVPATGCYLGFSFLINSQPHYAYAKIHSTGSAIVWDEVYYNATPGAPIVTGETSGTQGISNVAPAQQTPQVRKIMYRNRLYIERDGILYDITGRKAEL